MKANTWRCGRVRKALDAYAHSGLSAVESAAVEAHLGRCPRCTSEYDTLFAVRCVLDNYPRITPRADFDDAIVAAAMAQRAVYIPVRPNRRHRFAFSGPRLRLATSFALCAALCLMTISMLVWPQLRPAVLNNLFGGNGNPPTATLQLPAEGSTNSVLRSMPEAAGTPAVNEPRAAKSHNPRVETEREAAPATGQP